MRRKPIRTRADESRQKILLAAIQEFGERGLAGARTADITRVAGVNKALLYYYFRDKETLYRAALSEVAAQVAGSALAVLNADGSPGERLLRFTLQHFDRVLCRQAFQALMQQEMVRFHQGRRSAIPIITKKAFMPIFKRAKQLAQEGILSGELCEVDVMQMLYAALGANVFYFLSAPIISLIEGVDPLGPEAIPVRRRATVEFLGQAIFVNRRRGAQLAQHVLETMPRPEIAPLPEKKTA